MGINMNINVKNESEFNQQLQMYLAQGYRMQSNFNGTAILNKKSFSMGLLIVLIIFFFPAAIIYYLVASDDVVTIRLDNGQTSSSGSFNNTSNPEYVAYCPNCGQGLFKESKFCPGCGQDVSEDVKSTIEEEEEESEKIIQCPNCGKELTEGVKFCSECGVNLNDQQE